MKYTISQINWNNKDEVLFGNKSNSGTEIFSVSYANQKEKGLLPMVFIAKDENGKIIGRSIIGTYDEFEDRDFLVPNISHNEPALFGVFVEENYRNNGIGKALINKSIEYCKEKGFNFMLLDTHTAGKYYEKNWNFQFSHNVNWKNPVLNEIKILDVYYLKF